jgi:hypothetical protein
VNIVGVKGKRLPLIQFLDDNEDQDILLEWWSHQQILQCSHFLEQIFWYPALAAKC